MQSHRSFLESKISRWCPACNDAISQIFISFQCLALIFVVTEKLAQDVDKKWFFEKGVVTGRALP
jgi:hypothetical protein